ncbi:MAG TPA: twin-arginine translocase TatA/TatE family subunit [Microbacteriaceae bacterium]|nr:twin-arginine translocase TatA/TatE family subunit [Microbacteriaceae bacterium]
MLSGLSLDKLLIVGVIAVLLLGPTRLPSYAKKLAVLVKRLRAFASDAQDRMREEMGPGFDDVDWKKLDPRQYDPRRIIREALFDDGDDDADQVRTGISAPSDDAAQALADDEGTADDTGAATGGETPVDAAADEAMVSVPPFDQEAT